MNKYKCPACKKIVKRDSTEAKLTSYCMSKQKAVNMTKVKK